MIYFNKLLEQEIGMKMRMAIFAAIAAITSAYSGAFKPDDVYMAAKSGKENLYRTVRGLTDDDVRSLCEFDIESAKKNSWKTHKMPLSMAIISSRRFKFGHLAAEYDDKFASLGFMAEPWCSKFPKCRDAFLDSTNGFSKTYPVAARVSREGRWPYKSQAFPERLNLYVESYSRVGDTCFRVENIDDSKGWILKDGQNAIKRAMREHGLSFAVKDGRNPLQDAIDELASALNAPKASGVREFVSKWFPRYEWIEPVFSTDQEILKYCDSLYYGEREFNSVARSSILFMLGVEGFNKFVKRYNGDK